MGSFHGPLAALDRCTLNKGAFAFKSIRGAATAGLTVDYEPFFQSLYVASFLILDITFFQGQFLLDNFIDKDKHYEFPIELMVSSSFLHYHLGLDVTKPVFGVSDKVRLKTDCSATETTVKPVLSGHSKIGKTKILLTNGSLMKVESIVECSHWSILQYF